MAYRYYSTLRPIGPGTFPKEGINYPDLKRSELAKALVDQPKFCENYVVQAITPTDVCPSLQPCGLSLKALRGRGGVTGMTNLYNIGEGHPTVDMHRLTAKAYQKGTDGIRNQ